MTVRVYFRKNLLRKIYPHFFSERCSASKLPENYYKILKAWDPSVNNTSVPKPHFNDLIFSSLFNYCPHQLITFKSELEQLQYFFDTHNEKSEKIYEDDQRINEEGKTLSMRSNKSPATWKGLSDEFASNRSINGKKKVWIQLFLVNESCTKDISITAMPAY